MKLNILISGKWVGGGGVIDYVTRKTVCTSYTELILLDQKSIGVLVTKRIKREN